MQIITIKQIDNGFIVESKYPDMDTEVYAITEDYTNESEEERFATTDETKICIGRLLDKINDLVGVQYDKYGKENLNITWDKTGHKTDVDELNEAIKQKK